MNANQIVNLPETGDTDARAESVRVGCRIMVAGHEWFVDLADLMESRIPGLTCGRPAEELSLSE